MALIKNREVVADDSWVFVPDGADVPTGGDVVVTASRLLSERESLTARQGRLGVRIEPDEDAEPLAPLLDDLSLVAVSFPKFTDGRGYSSARLVRERFGFGGELRAVGNVLPDQVFYMARCGFDAFELAEGKDPEHALAALEEFSVTYQAASDDPRPLYRRRDVG